MDQIYFFRVISCLQCVSSYFQEKLVGFDRKEDFRSNFNEEQRSGNAQMDGRSKTEDCTTVQQGSTAMPQDPKLRTADTARHTVVHLTMCPSTAMRWPRCVALQRLKLFNAIFVLIRGGGLLWGSFEDQLGLD